MTVQDERGRTMGKTRSAADQQIADLLVTAKKSLDLSVAFLSRLDGTTQHLEVVETSVPVLVQEGARVRQDTSFCQAILDGKLPAVIPDVTRYPEAMKLPSARIPRIRSYVSTPVHLSDGSLYGTFCAFGFRSDKELGKRDEALMRVLASAAAVIVEPEVRDQERRTEIEGRLDPVVAGFSSLRHIVVTSPDVIKLDRSIAAGVAGDHVLATLVGSLVTFAHGSGARVVAEGVETADDAAALRGLGVDYGQGWHFGRPGPPQALAVPGPRTPADDAAPEPVLSR